MIEGIIFDLDGVIISTDMMHYKAWKVIADELGIYFDECINDKLRGVSRMESLEIILSFSDVVLSEKEKVALTTKKNNIYKKSLSQLSKNDVSHDVINTLKTLKSNNLKLAIGSSSKNAKHILSQIELTSFFDVIIDGNDIKNSKPDPEVFLLAATKLNLTPENCLVIEDAVSGVEAALSGGFKCIGIGQAVSCEKANYKVNSFFEILNFI